MMTRNDYYVVAAALRAANECVEAQGWDDRTYPVHMADAFAERNPRFDRARFLAACGVAP